jgi:hypothetical protein
MADEALALRAMKKIKEYQAKIAEYEEGVENLKELVANNLPMGEHELVDFDEDGEVNAVFKATVYRSKTFNEAYGKAARPDLWEKAALSVKGLTSARAKTALTPEEYAIFQKPSDKTSVKVEVVND